MLRLVGHLDMDAFFAAIEERDTPALRGLPLIVGADPKAGKGRGVVSTSNYKARKYGIHSAMPIATAWRLSEAARRRGEPPVTFVPVDMEKYAAVSDRVMGLVRRFVQVVEQVSIDEACFDLSVTGTYEAAEDMCRRIKLAIFSEERLTASVGVGPNKLIAKIASGMSKPDGLTVVRDEEAEAFLAPLPVRAIPGIGPKTEYELAQTGIRLVRDLKRFSVEELGRLFGKRGRDIYEKIRGHDETPIDEVWQPKSIGEQETFEEDTLNAQFLVQQLTRMCREVVDRVHAEGFTAFRTVVLTVRFADFETTSRARTVPAPLSEWSLLRREVLALFMPFLDARENPHRKLIRLLGVRVEKLQ